MGAPVQASLFVTGLDSLSLTMHTPRPNGAIEMTARRTSPSPSSSITRPESTPEVLERIRIRAYELFEQRGRHEGHELEDWLRAEAEVLQQTTKPTAA